MLKIFPLAIKEGNISPLCRVSITEWLCKKRFAVMIACSHSGIYVLACYEASIASAQYTKLQYNTDTQCKSIVPIQILFMLQTETFFLGWQSHFAVIILMNISRIEWEPHKWILPMFYSGYMRFKKIIKKW